ncbi:MAG: hypothetical protein ABL889_16870 [Terricaulis sp.]
MTVLGLVRDLGRALAPVSLYTIEYTSSEHRGIVMYSEAHNATSAAGALAYAKVHLPEIAAKYGARGYRVRDADGAFHASEDSAPR